MKNKLNIKTFSSIIPFLGLIFLLLISPCKVRNLIQLKLGIPQTEVANKNKATVHSVSCSSSEISKSTSLETKLIANVLPAVFEPKIDFIFNEIGSNSKSEHTFKDLNHSVYILPLYILYKNFKVYL